MMLLSFWNLVLDYIKIELIIYQMNRVEKKTAG